MNNYAYLGIAGGASFKVLAGAILTLMVSAVFSGERGPLDPGSVTFPGG